MAQSHKLAGSHDVLLRICVQCHWPETAVIKLLLRNHCSADPQSDPSRCGCLKASSGFVLMVSRVNIIFLLHHSGTQYGICSHFSNQLCVHHKLDTKQTITEVLGRTN